MIPIIYYHSVAPKGHPFWPRSWLTLELRFFEEHLKYLQANDYKPIDLNEYVELKRNEQTGKFVCLTFDDGYLDNYIYVYPLLKKYGFKGTIFVNPEFVDERAVVRPSLETYWRGDASLDAIDNWGFLSWEEMRLMQQSGVIDIQSHTMTHAMYFVSHKIIGFHHPGDDCLYPIGNIYPERKPYHIGDPEFEKLIPFGTPLFEEKSAVIARRVFIKDDFNAEIVNSLKSVDWSNGYSFEALHRRIETIYREYKQAGNIIQRRESETEYERRVADELKLSKDILEQQLQKPVEFCCWPHGDNDEFCHGLARQVGYKATTVGKSNAYGNELDRFERLGLGHYKNSITMTRLKMHYKIQSFQKLQPYYGFEKLYHRLRYGKV